MKRNNIIAIFAIIAILLAVASNDLFNKENRALALPSLSSDIAICLERLFPEPKLLTEAEKIAIPE